ncbi:MAG: EthD domain-containing protein [Parahaliea sp.]
MDHRVGLTKASLYFDAVSASDVQTLFELMRATLRRTTDAQGPALSRRISRRVSDMSPLPHQLLMVDSPKPFDFTCELSRSDAAQSAALADALVAVIETLGERIDRRNAAVFAGREIAITAGDGSIYVIMALRRVPSLSHEEFMFHWFDRHAALGEQVAGVRYRQDHVDLAATRQLAQRTGLDFPAMDGLAESYFDSLDDAIALLSHPDVAVGAIEDEKRFIHHPTSQFALYQTIWRD